MSEVIYKVDLPAFIGRNVPIKEIASAIGKDAQYVRLGFTTRNTQIWNGNKSRKLKRVQLLLSR